MSGRLIDAFTQFFDGAGDPLAYGWLQFLESGSNNTPKDTYNDDDLNVANANPLQLDGEGRCPSVFGEGRYRINSYHNDPNDETTPGQQIQSFDPVTAQEETAGGGGAGTFEVWDSSTEYSVGDIVTHSSKYYRSIANFNVNKNPAVEDGYWEEIEFVVYWNENVDYDIGEMVRDSGNLYFSTIANNLNNIPDDSPVEWRRVDRVFLTTDGYTTDYQVVVTDRDKLLTFGSSAILSGTFTLPAVTEDNDGFIYNFYNAADYDLYVVPTVPATLWLSNTITLKRGSYVQLQYNFEYDKWLPLNNSGPALGGQDIGTVSNPVLDMYLNDMYFVGNFDIDLDSTPMWRFHTDGTFYPLSTNPMQHIGTIADPVEDLWQDGTHYYGSADNTIVGTASVLTITAKTSLYNQLVDTPSYYTLLNGSGFSVVAPFDITGDTSLTGDLLMHGNIWPGSDNTYDLGSVSSREWRFVYVANSLYLNDTKGRLHHSGSYLLIYNATGHTYFDNPSGGDWYFREGTTARYIMHDSGIFHIIGYGSTSSYNLTLGTSAEGRIWYNSNALALYSNGHIDIYTNGSKRWWFDDTTGHLYPNAANTYQIGHPSYEVKSIYLGPSGAYFGLGQEGNISQHSTYGLLHTRMGVSLSNGTIFLKDHSFLIWESGGTWYLNIYLYDQYDHQYTISLST